MLMVLKVLLNSKRRDLLLFESMDMFLYVNIQDINSIGKTLKSGEKLKIYRSISINESILQKSAKNMKVLPLSGIEWH